MSRNEVVRNARSGREAYQEGGRQHDRGVGGIGI